MIELLSSQKHKIKSPLCFLLLSSIIVLDLTVISERALLFCLMTSLVITITFSSASVIKSSRP